MRTRRTSSSSDPVSTLVEHQSVLLHEAIDALRLKPDATVLDATLGGAGHTRAIAERLSAKGIVVGIDADHDAIDRTKVRLRGVQPTVRLSCSNFRALGVTVPSLGVTHLDGALFDLGWSSYQLAAGRGFSFMKDEPLQMTYGQSRDGYTFTAYDIVNTWEEENIADIIYGWGEERFARRIAKAIVAHRQQGPIETSSALSEIIAHAVPRWYQNRKVHPATKTFQAFRIAVNDEIAAVEEGLSAALGLLVSGGVMAVITFHSIEDRTVKRLFKAWAADGRVTLDTKKPITPGEEELAHNPRARSAKLRVCTKLS